MNKTKRWKVLLLTLIVCAISLMSVQTNAMAASVPTVKIVLQLGTEGELASLARPLDIARQAEPITVVQWASKVKSALPRYSDGYSSAVRDGNIILYNAACERGGGLYIDECDPILTNNVMADNRVIGLESGIYMADGGWVADPSDVALGNAILVSHTVGVTVSPLNVAQLRGTLWGSDERANEIDWGGDSTVPTGMHDYWGDAAFVDPGALQMAWAPDTAAEWFQGNGVRLRQGYTDTLKEVPVTNSGNGLINGGYLQGPIEIGPGHLVDPDVSDWVPIAATYLLTSRKTAREPISNVGTVVYHSSAGCADLGLDFDDFDNRCTRYIEDLVHANHRCYDVRRTDRSNDCYSLSNLDIVVHSTVFDDGDLDAAVADGQTDWLLLNDSNPFIDCGQSLGVSLGWAMVIESLDRIPVTTIGSNLAYTDHPSGTLRRMVVAPGDGGSFNTFNHRSQYCWKYAQSNTGDHRAGWSDARIVFGDWDDSTSVVADYGGKEGLKKPRVLPGHVRERGAFSYHRWKLDTETGEKSVHASSATIPITSGPKCLVDIEVNRALTLFATGLSAMSEYLIPLEAGALKPVPTALAFSALGELDTKPALRWPGTTLQPQ